MAEEIINELLLEVSFDPPESDVKRQKLIECVLIRNRKQYLFTSIGKVYKEEQINKLSAEEVDKLFSNYEAKLSDQMVKPLCKSVIRMYAMGACTVLGMSNQDELSNDLESDPFLNSTLQRFTCELYYRFGLILAPLSVRVMKRMSYAIKMERTTPSKYEGLGTAMAAELMIGFWFGTGVILAVRTVNSLGHCVEVLTSYK